LSQAFAVEKKSFVAFAPEEQNVYSLSIHHFGRSRGAECKAHCAPLERAAFSGIQGYKHRAPPEHWRSKLLTDTTLCVKAFGFCD
jgi:hypothetical protein